MKARREILLAAGVLLILVALTVAASFYQSKEEQAKAPPLSSLSNAPDGARALRLWLESLGYPVNNQAAGTFAIPAGTRAVFILEPDLLYNITADEWKTLETWVSGGGLLLMASRTIWLEMKGSTLGVSTRAVANKVTLAEEKGYSFSPAAPILRSPPILKPIDLTVRVLFRYNRADIVPLLTSTDGAGAIEVPHGKGRVILVADSDFLSNSGLKDAGHAAFAANLLSTLPKGGAVWMDEWHHGMRPEATEGSVGPEAWLQDTPSGRAILFSAAVIFVALLLAGRRFGRPVPLPSDQVRRAPLEHVTALANLNRRAGHRRALMQYYHTSLKRAFGHRYRLDPSLPDDQYVARLASYNPGLDAAALLDLLDRLSRRNPTDAQLVQLAREAAAWMNQLEHH